MKKIILILVLLVFIIGCTQKITEKALEEPTEEIVTEKIEEPQPEEISPEKLIEMEKPQEETKEILPKQWTTETADDDGWVGIDSSLAVDSDGNPYISHFDAKNKDLKYAYKKEGVWLKEVIDSKGHLGEESGIGVDSKGNVHISYNDATNDALKYAKKSGGSWSIETVDKKSGAHVVTTSLTLDVKGNPHIAYNMESPNGGFVKYASFDGSSWELEEAASGGSDVYLALDSNDNPHIAFLEGNLKNKKIYYTRKISGTWKTDIVDSSTTAGGDCGICIDSNNNVHVTYRDYGKEAIKYAKWDGTSWNIQTVAVDIGKEEGLRMAVDSKDNPHIVYADNKKEKLIHAFFDGASWTKEIISKMGIPSIFIDSRDNIHLSHGSVSDEEIIDPETGEEIEILKYSVKK